MISVIEEAGLASKFDPDGLTGRGLYIGKRKELSKKPMQATLSARRAEARMPDVSCYSDSEEDHA